MLTRYANGAVSYQPGNAPGLQNMNHQRAESPHHCHATIIEPRHRPRHHQHEPFIEPETRPKLHAYLATVARNAGCETYRVGGVADHVHLAIRLSRTITIADYLTSLTLVFRRMIDENRDGFAKVSFIQEGTPGQTFLVHS